MCQNLKEILSHISPDKDQACTALQIFFCFSPDFFVFHQILSFYPEVSPAAFLAKLNIWMVDARAISALRIKLLKVKMICFICCNIFLDQFCGYPSVPRNCVISVGYSPRSVFLKGISLIFFQKSYFSHRIMFGIQHVVDQIKAIFTGICKGKCFKYERMEINVQS